MFSKDRFKQFIKQCYKTQTAFADETGINIAHINFYVTGVRNPASESLAKFYEAGLSLDWLFGGECSMYANNQKGEQLRKQHSPNELKSNQEKIEKIKELINKIKY